MGILYTISPFVRSDFLPSYASMARVISDNFWLFNIYSFNPYIVREYMDFIDIYFDNAFSDLNLGILQYEYPDNITDEGDILEFINSRYKLHDTGYQLGRELAASKESIIDLVTEKEKCFYFNDYAIYDSMLSSYSILSDVDNDTMGELFDMVRYLKNDDTASIIRLLISKYEEYATIVDDISSHGIEFFDNQCISNGMYTLNQLVGFVIHEVNERSEE